jgi:hypothetical protein
MNLPHYFSVYNHITTHGIKSEGKFLLDEFTAWHDFDGYTCFIGYKDLTMSIYFHSRFSFDYDEESTLKAFNVLIDNFVV